MKQRIRLGLVAGLALALSISAAGTAAAHKRKIDRQTTVTFQDLPGSSGDRVSGVVSLGAPADPFDPAPGPEEFSQPTAFTSGIAGRCIGGASVTIRHNLTVGEGGGPASPQAVVARATTDASGAWQTTAYEASGANQLLFDTFHVKVEKRRLKPKNDRHKHVCLGATGNRTTFSS
jgi:hypothetical protein